MGLRLIGKVAIRRMNVNQILQALQVFGAATMMLIHATRIVLAYRSKIKGNQWSLGSKHIKRQFLRAPLLGFDCARGPSWQPTFAGAPVAISTPLAYGHLMFA